MSVNSPISKRKIVFAPLPSRSYGSTSTLRQNPQSFKALYKTFVLILTSSGIQGQRRLFMSFFFFVPEETGLLGENFKKKVRVMNRKRRKEESTTSSDSSSDSSGEYWRRKFKKLKKKLRKKRGRKYRQGISVSSYDSY